MAVQAMGHTQTTVADEVNILKRAGFEAIARTLDSTAFTNGVCKAGTPITTLGTIDNGSTSAAIGILLRDVYAVCPQGALIVKGYLNSAIVASNSGLTISASVKTKLPMVIWE